MRRFLPLILPAILLAIAMPSASISLEVWQDCQKLEAARPMVMDVDLSQPGLFKADLQQTGARCCGQIFYVRLAAAADNPSPFPSGNSTATELFDGLVAKLIVERLDGSTCAEFDLQHYDGIDRETGAMQIVGMHRPEFPNGKYKARIEVTTPAAALAGLKQTIYGRYKLCGLEYCPAYIFGLISLATGLPGVLLLLREAIVRRVGKVRASSLGLPSKGDLPKGDLP